MSFQENWRKHVFVHLGWIIGALVFLLIATLSVRLGPNDNVKDILNFAVSLSSLVLAGFAIVQALISGSALPDAVAQVRAAVDDVRDPANKLADAAQVIDVHSKNLGSQADEIRVFASEFKDLRLVQTSMKPTIEHHGVLLSEELLQVASPNIVRALYAAIKSYDTKKSYFDLHKALGMITGISVIGVINTLSSIGAIEQSEDFIVTDLKALHWLIDKRDYFASPTDESDAVVMEDSKPKIDEYFAGKFDEVDTDYTNF